MKYVIMADGRGSRWNNYKGVPKHLALVCGEPIIGRTVRMLYELTEDDKIIITSHDTRYDFPPATRYEPMDNKLEIDRFTYELIENETCFLYGDTIYKEEALRKIVNSKPRDLLFFGNRKSIVAISIADAEMFRFYFEKVKSLFLDGKISECKGWQIYKLATGQEIDSQAELIEKFVLLDDGTRDFNTPEEYDKL